MANAKAGCREQVLEKASSFGCWSKVNKREALQGIWERQGGRQQVTEGLVNHSMASSFFILHKELTG